MSNSTISTPESNSLLRTRTDNKGDNLSLANKHLKVKFDPINDFHQELKQQVDLYFITTGLSPKDMPKMYQKTLIILASFVLSWGLLVFAAQNWWQAAILCISLGMSIGGIGFSIQHDGNHRAYSNRPFINQIAGFTADLTGMSSYLWNAQHTLIHHSYTNILGVDNDINLGRLARFAPQQERMCFHSFQHIYMPFLYGFLLISIHFYHGFKDVIYGSIGKYKIPHPKGKDLFLYIAGKIGFFGLAFGIPCCFHPLWQVICCYLGTSILVGLLLSFVFQTAHCMPETKFVNVTSTDRLLASNWAVHQLETTVDFAHDNQLLSWYIGGLNYQVEHHLFPSICHIHYPAIAPIVRATCKKYGIVYHVLPSFRHAIASHLRWLWIMGNSDGELE